MTLRFKWEQYIFMVSSKKIDYEQKLLFFFHARIKQNALGGMRKEMIFLSTEAQKWIASLMALGISALQIKEQERHNTILKKQYNYISNSLIREENMTAIKPYEDSNCGVCFENLDEPYSIRCGHNFCEPCIDELLRRMKTPTCPKCRVPWTKVDVIRNTDYINALDRIRDLEKMILEPESVVAPAPEAPVKEQPEKVNSEGGRRRYSLRYDGDDDEQRTLRRAKWNRNLKTMAIPLIYQGVTRLIWGIEDGKIVVPADLCSGIFSLVFAAAAFGCSTRLPSMTDHAVNWWSCNMAATNNCALALAYLVNGIVSKALCDPESWKPCGNASFAFAGISVGIGAAFMLASRVAKFLPFTASCPIGKNILPSFSWKTDRSSPSGEGSMV